MNRLYNPRGNIKTNMMGKALRNAKYEGNLQGVPSNKIKHFEKSFEKNMNAMRGRIGSNVNAKEVDLIMKKIAKNKHDNITNSELSRIQKVVEDKNFDMD